MLLVRHRIGGRWGLPGGRRARRETSQCTAHRETWEETGRLVEVGRLTGRTRSTLFYACRLAGETPVAEGWGQPWTSRLEITDVQWQPIDELHDLEWRYEEQLPEIERAVMPAR